MNCPSCNADLPNDAAFCMKCGSAVAASVAPAPTDTLRATLEKALGAQYDILRLLGRGAMGAVYLAREKTLDRLVAVKVLPPETSDSSESRERFRREARTAAKLTHPNIVPLHAFGQVEDMMYFVMGYVRGESLDDRIRREARVSSEETRRILAEIADALDYAHRQGVVHRDIKPDNILIDDESGRPLLTDFGVAKARASGRTLTALGAAVGTPYYMSPEQASGEREIDGRSDLYSLGVTAYEMLAGERPFGGTDVGQLIAQHLTKEPAALNRVVPEVPDDLSNAIGRCLAKDPARRWSDGKALSDAVASPAATDGDVPFELRSLHGLAVRDTLVLIGAGYVTFGFVLWGGLSTSIEHVPVPLLLAFLFSIGPLDAINELLRARRGGFQWQQISRVALQAPRWWSLWYPAPYRPPGDVWERLPVELRRPRVFHCVAAVVALVVVIPLMMWMLSPPGILLLVRTPGAKPLAVIVVVGSTVFFAIHFVLADRRAKRFGREHGLDRRLTESLLWAPLARASFWQTPSVAKLLLPTSTVRRKAPTGEPRSAAELMRGIAEVAQRLSGPIRQVGSGAVAAARVGIASVQTLDKQIEALTQEVAATDIGTIEQQLEALREDAETDSDDRKKMRQLLTGQLELARKLGRRLDEALERRARLRDMLETLWLDIADLERQSEQGQTTEEISGKMRAVCQEIEQHVIAQHNPTHPDYEGRSKDERR